MSTKLQLTFDEYDELLEMFERIDTPTYWPTLEQLDIMSQNPEEWIFYACYLSEKGHKPKNQAEKYSQKNLSAFINEHFELVEDESEIVKKPMYIPDFLKGSVTN